MRIISVIDDDPKLPLGEVELKRQRDLYRQQWIDAENRLKRYAEGVRRRAEMNARALLQLGIHVVRCDPMRMWLMNAASGAIARERDQAIERTKKAEAEVARLHSAVRQAASDLDDPDYTDRGMHSPAASIVLDILEGE